MKPQSLRALLRLILWISLGAIPCLIVLVGIVSLATFAFDYQRVLPARPGMDMMESPAWSPSGELLAYECIYYTKEYLLASNRSEGAPAAYVVQDICLQKPTGEGFTRLTNSGGMSYPSWSPDSRYLAWVFEYRTIKVWDSRTSVVRDYQYPGATLFGASSLKKIDWSPDGSTLYLQDLGIALDLDTGMFAQADLLPDGVGYCCPSFSTTGEHFVYLRLESPSDGRRGMRTVVILDGVAEIGSSAYDVMIGSMAWSHDGNLLAWIARPEHWDDLDALREPDMHSQFLAVAQIPSGQTDYLELDPVVISDFPVWASSDRALGMQAVDDRSSIYHLGVTPASRYSRYVDISVLPTTAYLGRIPFALSPLGNSIAYPSSDGTIHIVESDGVITILSGDR